MDRERTDPNRLKDVRQQDLTESRLNQDFVDWLKEKGPTWLLVVLVAVTAYLGLVRWRQHRDTRSDEAWAALVEASLPRSKEDVAQEHPDIFAVPQLALHSGATQLLDAIQTGQPIDQTADPSSTTPLSERPKLTAEERDHYLTRADDMYRRVIDGEEKIEGDDGSLGWTLHALHAMFGRAAVAESRGDVANAKAWYEKAAKRAEPFYPTIAEQARRRAQTASRYATAVVLPAGDDTAAAPGMPSLPGMTLTSTPAPAPDGEAPKPATLDPVLRDLLLPTDDER